MTIDEAIAREKKRAKHQRILSSANHEGIESCIKCAEEHEQLAGWLEQLKRLIKLKEAMDNFVESVEVWCYLHEGEYDQKKGGHCGRRKGAVRWRIRIKRLLK